MWFLEAGFGRVDDPNPPPFADLAEAQRWITAGWRSILEERCRERSIYPLSVKVRFRARCSPLRPPV